MIAFKSDCSFSKDCIRVSNLKKYLGLAYLFKSNSKNHLKNYISNENSPIRYKYNSILIFNLEKLRCKRSNRNSTLRGTVVKRVKRNIKIEL